MDCGESGEDETIKLSQAIDVDKGVGNHCDFVAIISGEQMSCLHFGIQIN